jgi:hypothetical protein
MSNSRTVPNQTEATPLVSSVNNHSNAVADDISFTVNDDISFDAITHGYQMQALNAPPPAAPAQIVSLNRGQQFLGGLLHYNKTVAIVVMGEAVYQYAGAPEIPVPGDYMVNGAALMCAWTGFSVLHELGKRTHPANFLREVGAGSFALGLAKESRKLLISTIIPEAVLCGASFGRAALYHFAEDNMDEFPNLILALYYFNTPLLKTLMLSAVTLPLYVGGKKLFERCIAPLPAGHLEENLQLNMAQHTLNLVTEVLEALIVTELSLQVFSTIGPAYILHLQQSMAIPVIAASVVDMANYVATTPRPFEKLYPVFSNGDEVIDADANLRRIRPTRMQQLGGTSARLMIAALLVGTVAATSQLIIMSQDRGEEDRGNDPGAWDATTRIFVEAGLAAAYLLLKTAVYQVPSAVRWLRSCSLFRAAPAVNQPHEERAQANQEMNTFSMNGSL